MCLCHSENLFLIQSSPKLHSVKLNAKCKIEFRLQTKGPNKKTKMLVISLNTSQSGLDCYL